MGLRDVALSSGSACTSASLRPSHVLKALGVPTTSRTRSLRFGLGRWNTEEEVDFTIGAIEARSSAWEMAPMLRARPSPS